MANRRNNLNFAIPVALAACLAAGNAAAGPGTTGADVLKIDLGARPLALGGAYGAVGDDVQIMAYNPAGLAFLDRVDIFLLHFASLEEATYEVAGVGLPLPGWGPVGMHVVWRRLPPIDNPGAPDAPVTVNDVVLALGSAVPLAAWLPGLPPVLETLAVGVAVKGFYLQLREAQVLSFAGDAGLAWRAPASLGLPLTLSAAVQNLGPPVAFLEEADPLPLRGRFGAALDAYRGERHGVLLCAEALLPADVPPAFSAGVEYAFARLLFLRLGYVFEDPEHLNGPSAGLGVAFTTGSLRLRLDYAYRPQLWKGWESVANNHLLSLGIGF